MNTPFLAVQVDFVEKGPVRFPLLRLYSMAPNPNAIDATRVSIHQERDGRRFVLLPISFVSSLEREREREKKIALSRSLFQFDCLLSFSLCRLCARWSLFLPSIRRSISSCLYLLPIRRFERHCVQCSAFMDWPNRSNYDPLHFQGGWPNGKWKKRERGREMGSPNDGSCPKSQGIWWVRICFSTSSETSKMLANKVRSSNPTLPNE